MKFSVVIGTIMLISNLNGCRTTDRGTDSSGATSELAGDIASQNALPHAGTNGAKCGRDGAAPKCAKDHICVQSQDGSGAGTCYVDPDRTHRPEKFTFLKNLKVLPRPGGINPAYSALSLNADVMTGSNPCLAKGVKGELMTVTEKSGDMMIIHVWPVTVGIPSNNCRTREFIPQYKSAKLQLNSLDRTKDRVIVHGIQDQRSPNAKLIFGTECPVAQCAQPPEGCSMFRPTPTLLNEYGCPLINCGIMECKTEQAECKSGEVLTEIGRDPKSGCNRKPVCVGSDTCPMRLPPPPGWCKGRIVPRGMDARGCSLGAACLVDESSCPQLSQPPPGWCKDGEIVGMGVDERGCSRAPRCIRPGECK